MFPEPCSKLDERLWSLSMEIVTSAMVAEATALAKIQTRVVGFMVTTIFVVEKELG